MKELTKEEMLEINGGCGRVIHDRDPLDRPERDRERRERNR